ncbi:DNA-3-methyladenine glycosylase I [Acetonema longum DSM 6540]|uniref:DNA-3-methyladenine glycosylase I n=1 Tax=Acetonema longum DSM 6540 TaxID=1009370 RepID=F7NEV1_9FIRM|nr:DNA-3-methyladenine glycosylase I [Acetonema longum DSM 6540]
MYVRYHDQEWGVPVYDDRKLFEFLILEGAQAGLSWITVLRKRENYRQAFDGFDAGKIAAYSETDLTRLLANPGIIRNRLKLAAAVANARAYLAVQDKQGNFNSFIWKFVDGKPVQNAWATIQNVPAETKQSQAMSKELSRLGFKFVGPTICYAFMQAVGMVNDHVTQCFRYEEIRKAVEKGSCSKE